MQYSSKVQDYFFRRDQAGVFTDEKYVSVGQVIGQAIGQVIGLAGVQVNGAVLEFSCLLDSDGKIVDAKFRAFGGPIIIACGAFVAEWLVGKALTEAKDLAVDSVMQALELKKTEQSFVLIAKQAVDNMSKANDYHEK